MDALRIPPDINLTRYTLNIAYRVSAHFLAEYIVSMKQKSLRPSHKQADICFLSHFMNKFRKRSFSLSAFNAPPVRLGIIRYEQYIEPPLLSFLQRLVPYKVVALFIFFLTCISPTRGPLVCDTLKGLLFSLPSDIGR